MGCRGLNGIAKGCKGSGGIKNIVLFDLSGVTNYAFDVDGMLTELDLDAAFDAYSYKTMQWSSNLDSGQAGGTRDNLGFYTPTLTMIFSNNSKELVKEINAMNGLDLVAIVQDQNDKFWTVGLNTGLYSVSSAGFQTGVALGDQNQNTVVLAGEEKDLPYSTDVVSGSLIDAKILAAFGIV